MNSELPTITPQPGYPGIPLAPSNERMLSSMLRNPTVLFDQYSSISMRSDIVPEIDSAANRIMWRLYSDKWDQVDNATDHGIMVFGSIVGCVEASVAHAPRRALRVVMGEIFDADDEKLAVYKYMALKGITEHDAATREVVEYSAERLYPRLLHYSLVGAALSRQITLDIQHESLLMHIEQK